MDLCLSGALILMGLAGRHDPTISETDRPGGDSSMRSPVRRMRLAILAMLVDVDMGHSASAASPL